jgi:hypothetical protein
VQFLWALILGLVLTSGVAWASSPTGGTQTDFPPSLESYEDADLDSIPQILAHRVQLVPFNLVATLIFFCAIVHTFMASKFSALSHQRRLEHRRKIDDGEATVRQSHAECRIAPLPRVVGTAMGDHVGHGPHSAKQGFCFD